MLTLSEMVTASTNADLALEHSLSRCDTLPALNMHNLMQGAEHVALLRSSTLN